MTNFEEILAVATARAGGAAALEDRLPQPRPDTELQALSDDRYLSDMSRRIFRTGLRQSMVDGKWPAFEEVFLGFDPHRIRAMNDEALEGLMKETRIIRHWGKIKSVRANAAAMIDITEESGGGFGAWLAGWGPERTVALWEELTDRFTQLGGNSGPYFLRMVGKDTFVLTDNVVRALNHWGVYDGAPKGKRARREVGEVFEHWRAESGRPLCQISMTLALSVD